MVSEYRAIWSVPGGGTGYSVFHFPSINGQAEANVIAGATRAFFAAVGGSLPNEVTITFDSEVRVMDTVTGVLTQTFAVSPPASVTGGQAGVWAGGVGAVISWETGIIVAGKRLRGRTFIVPLAGNAYDTSGTLAPGIPTILNDAASTFRGATAVGVWSRTHGTFASAVSTGVPDRSAILRGRRD